MREFVQNFENSISQQTFVKLILSAYHGDDPVLKKIIIKKINVKNQELYQFTYRNKTNDVFKNHSLPEVLVLLQLYISENGFWVNTLFTTQSDIVLSFVKNNWKSHQQKASTAEVPSAQHNHEKNRKINSQGKSYLVDLNILDKDGKIFDKAQDKYKQICHFVEILSTLLQKLPQEKPIKVLDMGAGKGYLTFALYDYLVSSVQADVEVIGVEYRADLVTLCNQIAQKSGFKNLIFHQGTIENYESEDITVLMALHACDTATDDAIYKGITKNADLIIVAPCCHKQIRNSMAKNKVNHDFDFMTKHGIFLERQAEMITDGMRALILEYFGYQTRVFEFIADAHTAKNVLIVAEKKANHQASAEILAKLKAIKKYFGIDAHYLEKIAGI